MASKLDNNLNIYQTCSDTITTFIGEFPFWNSTSSRTRTSVHSFSQLLLYYLFSPLWHLYLEHFCSKLELFLSLLPLNSLKTLHVQLSWASFHSHSQSRLAMAAQPLRGSSFGSSMDLSPSSSLFSVVDSRSTHDRSLVPPHLRHLRWLMIQNLVTWE